MFILPIMQKPTIPTRWTFLGEKETLGESNEPSLIKVRWLLPNHSPEHFAQKEKRDLATLFGDLSQMYNFLRLSHL